MTQFPATRTAALEALSRFLPHAGGDYARRRNFDLGPGQHNGVSQLSPYLRRRMITETEVLQAVMGRFSPKTAEKFIQEVFWRTYWKGWLQLRPSVWDAYLTDLNGAWNDLQTQSGLRSQWEAACTGQTGIECFDHWARELTETGYLHNHARMWFASIWIFTLRLPWVLGADFFLRHLLDGDPASNTLSWRWVGGLQTPGKTYLARPDNIARYTEGRFVPTGLATYAPPLPMIPHPAPQALPPAPALAAGRTGLLLHAEDLNPGWIIRQIKDLSAAAYVSPEHIHSLKPAPMLTDFETAARADMQTRYATEIGQVTILAPDEISKWAAAQNLSQIVTSLPPVGPVAGSLKGAGPVPLIQIPRPYDSRAWPHATQGFFRFKDKIPEFLASL